MKKKTWILQYVLAILEGAVSGVCFYRAWHVEKRTGRMVLLLIASAVWFACSVLSSFQGGRELRELKNRNEGDEDHE